VPEGTDRAPGGALLPGQPGAVLAVRKQTIRITATPSPS
jgi:hypothetical protein